MDYIQFENPMLVERFLDYWRKTGNQRIGFLYGRYEHHKDVPLGIRAVVSAIYEPQQVNHMIVVVVAAAAAAAAASTIVASLPWWVGQAESAWVA